MAAGAAAPEQHWRVVSLNQRVSALNLSSAEVRVSQGVIALEHMVFVLRHQQRGVAAVRAKQDINVDALVRTAVTMDARFVAATARTAYVGSRTRPNVLAGALLRLDQRRDHELPDAADLNEHLHDEFCNRAQCLS